MKKCEECGSSGRLYIHKQAPGSELERLCITCHGKRHGITWPAWASEKPRLSIEDWALEIVAVLAALVILAAFIMMVKAVVAEIETEGLKSIVESVWYGKGAR